MQLTSKDWSLLVIAAALGESVSPVQLQKSLFLIGENLTPTQLGVKKFYTFKPYDYGPFNSTVYSDAETLALDSRIVILNSGTYRRYVATTSGLAHAEEIRKTLDSVAKGYLDRVVKWVREQSFESLIKSIYK